MRIVGRLGALGMMGLLGRMGRMGRMGLMGLMGTIAACSEAPEASEASEAPFSPEAPASPATPITFSSALADSAAVTRSETPLELTAHAFTVFGYKNMTASGNSYGDAQQVFTTGGYRVTWTANSAATTTTNTHDWEYVGQQPAGQEEQTIKYWDWSARAYRFFAVAEVSDGNTGAGGNGGNTGAGGNGSSTVAGTNAISGTYNSGATAYTVTFKADANDEATTPYYSHLWFSTGNKAEYPDKEFGKPVKLVFLKPLCKVSFRFIFEDPDDETGTTLTDMSFRPTNGTSIKLESNVSITYPLEGSATAEEVAVTSAEGDAAMAAEGMTTDNHTYSVLPATGQGTYTLTVSVNGEPKTAVVPAEFMEWKPGVEYTYIFKIHVDMGVSISSVQSAFTPWTDHNQTTIIYNW